MKHRQNVWCAGRRLALVLSIATCGLAWGSLRLPAQAAPEPASGEIGARWMEEPEPEDPGLALESQEPPDWWYAPGKTITMGQTAELFEQPAWWYATQDYQESTTVDFTTIDVAVTLGGSQGLNGGVIPLDIRVTADGTTPEVVIQVVCDEMPDRVIYVGYEKSPGGAVQTLGGFQQARFVGGVGPANVAEVQFQYEALAVGWLNFEVQVLVGDNPIYGPHVHPVYVSAVTPTFTSLDVTVTPGASQGLNAGAIPLDIQVTADGRTPEVVVQVVCDEMPDRVIYVDYEKSPDGAVQTLGKFQQARFVGGVGPGNTAEIQFQYEPLAVGWLNFEVQVWVGDNLAYGPHVHPVYVSAVTPTFTNLDVTVTPGGSQGLNAGVIPLGIRVTADGTTPELVVQVVCDEMPDRAIYVGYEKTPNGAVQTLRAFQQARFAGGVGPGNVAEVQFNYETLEVGWVNFTVQVKSEGNLLHGPERHSVYVRESGAWAATFPPLIKDFYVALREDRQATFNVEASGNPAPQYELTCGGGGAGTTTEGFSCLYPELGLYVATLRASNVVEGMEYSEVATTRVLVADNHHYIPLVMGSY